jgi:hypothetical protein
VVLMRVAAATTLAALIVLLAACGATSPGAYSSSPTPSTSASPPAEPTSSPSPTPSPIASPSPSASPIACLPQQGGTASRATITDVRVGSHPGYDRLVVEFSGGLPAYKLVAQDPSTFVGPYSGKPVSVAGSAGIHLFIYNMDIPPSFQHGANLRPGFSVLKQVLVMAVFEGQADIALGLGIEACPSASTLSNPYRLVIDFPAQ